MKNPPAHVYQQGEPNTMEVIMKVIRTILATLLLALAFALAACTVPAAEAEAAGGDELVLKTYDVPAGYGSQVESLLIRLLNRGQDAPPLGRAYQASEIAVCVAAPKSFHAGVPQVIEAFARADSQGQAPRNVRITYWVVSADASATVETGDMPSAVYDALEPIARVETPMTYELQQTRRLVSMDGDRASSESADGVDVQQTVSLAPGGGLVADIALHMPDGADIRTRITARPGQVVVLGESGGGRRPEDHDRYFFVIRPEVIEAE